MTDDQFQRLCNTFGFAPSRALREMLDEVTKQEREACAKVCESLFDADDDTCDEAEKCAAAIRSRT